MEYAQLNEARTEAIQVTTHGNVEWDATHFCPASALTPDEAEYFRVVPLTVNEPPAFDPLTQSVMRNGCEQVGGVWQYRWDVVELFATQEEKDAALALDRASKAAVKVEAIKAERDRRKFNGVRVGTQWLHTDTYSRTQWLGMVIMGASLPAIAWTTMDGTSVTTSQTLAGAVFQGTAQLDATLFGYAKSLITQVEAAADPASVDITAGWPLTYGAV